MTAPDRPLSRNVFKRFKADIVFAGSNYLAVQQMSPEVLQLLREVRDLLARIEERPR